MIGMAQKIFVDGNRLEESGMVSESGERYQQSDKLCLATGVGLLK
jgi:hypothetical protein